MFAHNPVHLFLTAIFYSTKRLDHNFCVPLLMESSVSCTWMRVSLSVRSVARWLLVSSIVSTVSGL